MSCSGALTPARAAAALPVLAVLTTRRPVSSARATTIALARSFSEAVGLRPSSLSHSAPSPSSAARRGDGSRGVSPTGRGGTTASDASGSSGRQRHMLLFLACRKGVAIQPRAQTVIIVEYIQRAHVAAVRADVFQLAGRIVTSAKHTA